MLHGASEKTRRSLPWLYSSNLKIADIQTHLRRLFPTGGAVFEKPWSKCTVRYPSRKQPQPGWKYLQVVKQRDEKGNFLGTELKAIYGDLEELVELLGKSTVYVERTHLTMRTFSSRLTRKSIAFSKEIGMHKACAAIEDMYYNLIRPHKTLRLKNEDGGGKNGKNGLPQWRQG